LHTDLSFLEQISAFQSHHFAEITLLFGISLIYFFGLFIYLKNTIKTLEETSQAKSFFIQKLYYELRNPLNGIIGFSQMLLSDYFGELSTKQKERLKDINKCGVEIQTLIGEFLDLSKGKNGTIELVETFVPIQEIINKVIELLEHNIQTNNINLITHITNSNISFYCDKNKIVTAIKNLLDNAIKFTSKNSQVTLSQYIRNNGLELIISDTGIGMTEEDIAGAFLYPDDTKKIKVATGVGLGLPIAKLFITLHGGKISIESKKDLGTTVIIRFPIKKVKRLS